MPIINGLGWAGPDVAHKQRTIEPIPFLHQYYHSHRNVDSTREMLMVTSTSLIGMVEPPSYNRHPWAIWMCQKCKNPKQPDLLSLKSRVLFIFTPPNRRKEPHKDNLHSSLDPQEKCPWRIPHPPHHSKEKMNKWGCSLVGSVSSLDFYGGRERDSQNQVVSDMTLWATLITLMMVVGMKRLRIVAVGFPLGLLLLQQNHVSIDEKRFWEFGYWWWRRVVLEVEMDGVVSLALWNGMDIYAHGRVWNMYIGRISSDALVQQNHCGGDQELLCTSIEVGSIVRLVHG